DFFSQLRRYPLAGRGVPEDTVTEVHDGAGFEVLLDLAEACLGQGVLPVGVALLQAKLALVPLVFLLLLAALCGTLTGEGETLSNLLEAVALAGEHTDPGIEHQVLPVHTLGRTEAASEETAKAAEDATASAV